jgi:hypothetical protein
VIALGIFEVPRTQAVSYGILLHIVAYAPPIALGAGLLLLKAIPWPGAVLKSVKG